MSGEFCALCVDLERGGMSMMDEVNHRKLVAQTTLPNAPAAAENAESLWR